jgi:peptidoglycan/LPS O-acetylase OafA/YrhL
MTTPVAPHERLVTLDLLRFIAAMSVVIYHMTYIPNQSQMFGSLQTVSEFGYLGVDLFFVISGFVILWSANGRTVSEYLISRVTRLYPSYWASILLTTATLYLLRPEHVQSLWAVVANFTMLPGYLKADYVDGVYWTLAIELKFYFLVLLCLLFGQMRRIEFLLWIWLALTFACYLPHAPHALASVIIFPYGAYFIAGSTFYLIWRGGPTLHRCAALAICFALTTISAETDRAGFLRDVTPVSTWVVIGFLVVVFGLFGAISLRLFGELRSRFWLQLGTLTYPLYLIHNEIGKAIFRVLGADFNEWLDLLATLAVVIAISWLLAVIVEQGASPALRRLLTRPRPKRTESKTATA